MKDSFKLYIVTIFIMVILAVIGIIETILSKNYGEIKMFQIILLQFTDLMVIYLTQREIQLHFHHTFIRCRRSNANPAVNNA